MNCQPRRAQQIPATRERIHQRLRLNLLNQPWPQHLRKRGEDGIDAAAQTMPGAQGNLVFELLGGPLSASDEDAESGRLLRILRERNDGVGIKRDVNIAE